MSGEGETCEAGEVAMDSGCEVARCQPVNEAEGMAADGVDGAGSVCEPSVRQCNWVDLACRETEPGPGPFARRGMEG